jgi:acyl-CoA synthetase (AMP-forming)/AMP-acid ligase II
MTSVQLNIAQLAQFRAESSPSVQAFSSETQGFTYAEVYGTAVKLAAGLRFLGLGRGDVLAFQLPNWVEAAAINVAAALLGVVCVPIVTIYRDTEVQSILADCGAKAIFFPTAYRGFDFSAMMARVASRLPSLLHRISVRSMQSDSKSFEALLGESMGPEVAPAHYGLDDAKVIMYTSGTTGTAKGVVHNHRTMTRVMEISCAHWGIGRGDTVLMPSPVTHTTGYANGLELPFVIGTQTLLMERWDAKVAVELIDSRGVAMMIGATPFLQELLTEAVAKNSRLKSLRIFACGGASIPPDLIRRANGWFENAKVFRVYGSTEAPLVTLGFLQDGQIDLAAETDGEFVDYQVKVADEAHRIVPQGEDGEICVRGPCLFSRYTNDQVTRDSFDSDGFFLTGDIGHVTQDHAIVITDRKKDLIIRGGEKLSAREVEEALLTHPLISDVAAVRMPHARLGETICLYAVLQPGARVELKDIHGHMASLGFAKQKFPERLEICEALPRTPSGKIRKDELRTRILATLAAETA